MFIARLYYFSDPFCSDLLVGFVYKERTTAHFDNSLYIRCGVGAVIRLSQSLMGEERRSVSSVDWAMGWWRLCRIRGFRHDEGIQMSCMPAMGCWGVLRRCAETWGL